MSMYQFFVMVHGLKDVLVWLVPLVVAVLLCVTALVISSRWIRERKMSSGMLSHLLERIETMESRLEALERMSSYGGRIHDPESGSDPVPPNRQS